MWPYTYVATQVKKKAALMEGSLWKERFEINQVMWAPMAST